MPDAYGNFKGQGWSQKRSDAWERVFGGARHAKPPVIACPNGHGERAESARENQNRDTEPPPA